MDFHEQARHETLALLDRMHADSATRSLREIQVLRDTLAAATQSVEQAVTARAADSDIAVASLAEHLSQVAADRVQAAVDRVTLDSHAEVESVRTALAEQATRNGELTDALEEAHAQTARLETALAQATASAEQLRTVSAEQLQKEAAERTRLAAALAKFSQPFDALVTAYQDLDNAATADDVLVALVNGLVGDFSRVALFRVNAHRLEGVHQIGFNFESDISKVVIPLTIDSLLSHAVASGRVEVFTPAELPAGSRIPFSGSPAFILTLPVIVRSATLAVIYADDAGRASEESIARERILKFVQVLLWHAVPKLTRLSTNLIELTELRQDATMLVNEIGHIYDADASAGKSAEELRGRLRDNLQCARQIFAQRVMPEGPFAATLLEEQLALQAQSGTPFGCDVAVVIGRSPTAARTLEAAS